MWEYTTTQEGKTAAGMTENTTINIDSHPLSI